MQCDFNSQALKDKPTPYYLYDLGILDDTLQTIDRLISGRDQVKVHYAIKANNDPIILQRIANHGLGADCVSGGEMRLAEQNGFLPTEMMFAGVGKRDEEITWAIQNHIQSINVESIEELQIIDAIAQNCNQKANIALRINPDIQAHTHAHISTGHTDHKFGIPVSQIATALNEVQKLSNIRLNGLHFHIGSQITDMSDFMRLAAFTNGLMRELSSKGFTFTDINVGGGLGVDYEKPQKHVIPDFKSYFDVFFNHLHLSAQQRLHFELGRSIVAQCGMLITRVLYVKKTENKNFIIVDAGMNDLMRPALYGASHLIINTGSHHTHTTYDVVGPVCESSDVFAKDISLPETSRGDLLAIMSVGAYGRSMASEYNCRPIAPSYYYNSKDKIER